ncbi:MAG TPA: DUF5660 family protein [Alphaproteobacteria bacterium]|jgi:hypothetical protein|nr:DUF5660 family protein [Alphaproteobacteria bacterium]
MSDSKKKSSASNYKQSILESLKDLGNGTADVLKNDLFKQTSEDFFSELMGLQKIQSKKSGELSAGQSVNMNEILSGKEEENKKLRAQISFERQLSADQNRLSQETTNQLKVQLQALTSEVQKVAVSTGNLAEATQVAMIQAPSNPGIYHIIFFEKVLEFLQSFRARIDQASVWLTSSNKRAEKKNYWSMYKKKGSSFLLSPDHYLQRSAG